MAPSFPDVLTTATVMQLHLQMGSQQSSLRLTTPLSKKTIREIKKFVHLKRKHCFLDNFFYRQYKEQGSQIYSQSQISLATYTVKHSLGLFLFCITCIFMVPAIVLVIGGQFKFYAANSGSFSPYQYL